jgi:GT2 family glycosyltransferase
VQDGIAFSVVIPTYNRAAHVAQCLAPFLAEDARGIDVVVVDDGSTDGTEAAVLDAAGRSRGAQIRYLRQANAGPGAARNRGIAEAEREWVVFHDIDDRWFDWSVATLRAAIARAGDASLLFFRAQRFLDDGELAGAAAAPLELAIWKGFTAFAADPAIGVLETWGSCNVALRKVLLEQLGGFEPSIRCAEDVDLFLRVPADGRVAAVMAPAVMGYRTGGADSLSGNPGRTRDGMQFVLRGMRSGRYSPSAGEIAALVGRQYLFLARVYFSEGRWTDAYRLLVPEARLLIGQWGFVTWLKTGLTPVLSLLRPTKYTFSSKPAAGRLA